MSTHEDWVAAKAKRESAALRAVRYLRAGEIEAAKAAASESHSHEQEMARIEQELDG